MDENGEWIHILVGAIIGGVVNLAMNWNNCDGPWEYIAAFGVGAAGGAATAAVGGTDGGASFWAITGTAAAAGALTSSTNSVIAQTGENFSGMNQVNWGLVGKQGGIGAISGFAGSAAGTWAANSSMLVNGVNSPILRSAIVSPIASGAGHVAGSTAYGLFEGQSLGQSFSGSFNGLGQSMALGTALGVTSTVAVSYGNKVNPFTGKAIVQKNTPQYDLSPDPNGDNITLYRGTTGSERDGGALFMTDDPNYAATYVRNGGRVVEITIPRSTLWLMQQNGLISLPTPGIYAPTGVSGSEYIVSPSGAKYFINVFK